VIDFGVLKALEVGLDALALSIVLGLEPARSKSTAYVLGPAANLLTVSYHW
jgi:hypothetical protein